MLVQWFNISHATLPAFSAQKPTLRSVLELSLQCIRSSAARLEPEFSWRGVRNIRCIRKPRLDALKTSSRVSRLAVQRQWTARTRLCLPLSLGRQVVAVFV